jgi:hypothetical protein
MPSCPPRRWKPWGPLLLLIAAGQPQPFVVVKELYKGIEDLYKKSSHINVISITRHLRSRGIWIHRQTGCMRGVAAAATAHKDRAASRRRRRRRFLCSPFFLGLVHPSALKRTHQVPFVCIRTIRCTILFCNVLFVRRRNNKLLRLS